jgi:PAS domain S-box-containing protein
MVLLAELSAEGWVLIVGAFFLGLTQVLQLILQWLSKRDQAMAARDAARGTRAVSAQVEQVRLATNGMKDQLIAQAGREGRAEGRAEVARDAPYAAAVALVVADEDGRIVEWNAAATLIFHWDRADVMGQNISILISPAHRGAHARAFRKAVEERRGPIPTGLRDLVALTANGEEIPVILRLDGWESDGKWFYSAEIRRPPAPLPPVPLPTP